MEIKSLLTLQFIPCHRHPNRSLIIHGKPFLCYRCLSILIGYVSIPLFLSLKWSGPWYLGLLFQIPMLVDGVTQYWKWRESNQILRIATGLLSGIGQSLQIILCASFITHILLRIT